MNVPLSDGTGGDEVGRPTFSKINRPKQERPAADDLGYDYEDDRKTYG